MTYDSEIFSLEIEPPEGSPDKAVIMRLCLSGEFLMFEADAFAFDEKIYGIHAIKLKPGVLLTKLIALAQDASVALADCPSSLFVDEASPSSQYVLSLANNIISGDFAFGDLNELKDDFGKDDLKKIKWNNKVVSFINSFTDVLGTEDLVGMIIKESPLLHLLNPTSRYLLHEVKDESDGFFEPVKGIDSAIKAALKKSIGQNENIDGETYNSAFVTIRQKFLSFLDSSRTREAFDKGHESICRFLSLLPGLDYSLAAYSLDLAYIYALLEGSLIADERKVAFLHSPLSPLEVKAFGGGDSLTFFRTLVAKSRKEASFFHISPAYMYLESFLPKNDDDSSLPNGNLA